MASDLPGIDLESGDGHQKHSFEKPRTGRTITFVTMDLTGTLRVADPDTFRESLFNGIGPTKAVRVWVDSGATSLKDWQNIPCGVLL